MALKNYLKFTVLLTVGSFAFAKPNSNQVRAVITEKEQVASATGPAIAPASALNPTTAASIETKKQPLKNLLTKSSIASSKSKIQATPKTAVVNNQKAVVNPKGLPITKISAPVINSSMAAPATVAEKKFVSFNMVINPSYNMAAEKPKEGKRNEYLSYDLLPSVTIGPIRTLVWLTYIQNLNDSKLNELQDFPVVWNFAKPFDAGSYLTLSPAVVLTVPQTKASKDNVELNYALGVNNVFGLNTKNLGIPSVMLTFQTMYTKFDNDATTTVAGEPTNSYRFRQRLNFWYSLTDSFSFKSRLQYDSAFSYENVVRNAFLHYVALEYAFLPNLKSMLGTTNSGPALDAAANYENNLKFYDKDSSEYFLTLEYSI